MRVRTSCKSTPSEGNLLPVKATLLLVSCLTLLSVVRPANAQTYTGNANGPYGNGLVWTSYRKPESRGYAAITPGANGNYKGSWDGFSGNFTMGAGWSGNDSGFYYKSTVNANAISNVGYNVSSYSDDKKGTVSVYGFVNANSTNPRVEFYIVERYTPAYSIPGEGSRKASNVPLGDGFYNIYLVNKGSFVQYWSVRTSQASAGNHTVPVNQHFAKWESLNMKTSKNRQYMYLSTESLFQFGGTAKGSVNATVWGY